MLCMCANGCLWEKAVAGSSPLYDDLVRGWEKWNDKHTADNTSSKSSKSSTSGTSASIITESDYPHVSFFDKHINPPALRRVLLTMLNPDPARRVTMAQVAANRWLRKAVECCQVDSYDDPAVVIDASKPLAASAAAGGRAGLVVQHSHLPPAQRVGHKFVRLPGSTDIAVREMVVGRWVRGWFVDVDVCLEVDVDVFFCFVKTCRLCCIALAGVLGLRWGGDSASCVFDSRPVPPGFGEGGSK